jgi:hypothetical protein
MNHQILTIIAITIAIVLIAFGSFVLWFDLLIRRNWRRYKEYKKATMTSRQKNKPLMVIGSTDSGGISGQISSYLHLYGCGDVCIDMNGCKKCTTGITSRIEDILPTLKDNSYVIYVSVVLEYVDDLPTVIKELERVSGGDLFVVYMDNILDIKELTRTYFDLSSGTTLHRKWNIKSGYPNWEWSAC